ncbi:MAG: fibrobacter succinogenes major paralogous domain-containing protein [Saprospiraceae bacterium]|nr:fibrobacter succinogenes major paralogous domain-containing protein [Saprospiraceae bacterium]MDP4698517.1 fibrobacter succinogenes major paralogous domain-containing protein [Saprospiraceae bacterium]MDP4810034.1 fibrobacter succinogenes major paralogous domain-containing protein [Saprospiraceae bacterium]MDP4813929.1 fibrobacter succinogenes major paralogous domain-containing protein [Saprospiraceae bacterium]MDP5048618.1 fibrobacter succinogenes major paralogous domain-containing protein 
MARILFLMMFPFVCFSQITPSEEIPVNNLLKEKENLDTKRKASYNLDEIKVRWKKAALENCTGVPCLVTPHPPSFTCGTSTVTDVDENSYETVVIGNQCWTKKNLRTTMYNDSVTSIPIDASGGSAGNASGSTWFTLATGAYTIYGNESSTDPNATNYGYLYNWYAVGGIILSGGVSDPTKNICPVGWRVPSTGDLAVLTNILGSDPSTQLKENSTL